jgi:two-component system NtrC family sensor kinase
VRIELQLDAKPSQVIAVEAWLKQVCLNIMLNAIQQIAYKRAGGGTLTVRTEYRPEDAMPLKIYFVDDGPGIHAQHQERVFELGFTTKKDGVGLGLFISRGLVESLGGRVSVKESIMLVGTTFLVELPIDMIEGEAE